MNYHPSLLAQHFVGRLKAFPEDFPSLAVSAQTNFCSTHPVSNTLGIFLLPFPSATAELPAATRPPAPGCVTVG